MAKSTKRVTFLKAFRLNLVDKLTGVRSQMDFTPGVYDLDTEIYNHWFVQGILSRQNRRKDDSKPEVMGTPKPRLLTAAPPSGLGAGAKASLLKAQSQARIVVPQVKSA